MHDFDRIWVGVRVPHHVGQRELVAPLWIGPHVGDAPDEPFALGLVEGGHHLWVGVGWRAMHAAASSRRHSGSALVSVTPPMNHLLLV